MLKIRTPELIYSTETDGFFLSTLYMKLKPYQGMFKAIFLVVQTTEGDLMGAFVDMVLSRNDREYTGNDESFVFAFRGEEPEKFVPSKKNSNFCLSSKDCIAFGSDSAALYLLETLQEGNTNPCATFDSPPLTF